MSRTDDEDASKAWHHATTRWFRDVVKAVRACQALRVPPLSTPATHARLHVVATGLGNAFVLQALVTLARQPRGNPVVGELVMVSADVLTEKFAAWHPALSKACCGITQYFHGSDAYLRESRKHWHNDRPLVGQVGAMSIAARR